ncbi:MAG: hypothetical protein IPN29_08385 [Saprospiraceae bacterium]|nr:hypothetical protein [Saprospiraceae bacterium]
MYIFSAWSFIDPSKYDLGDWKVTVEDASGNQTAVYEFYNRNSHDVHDQWVRAELEIKACQDCTYKFYFNTNRELGVDELLFRPRNRYVLSREIGHVMYNGFRVDAR